MSSLYNRKYMSTVLYIASVLAVNAQSVATDDPEPIEIWQSTVDTACAPIHLSSAGTYTVSSDLVFGCDAASPTLEDSQAWTAGFIVDALDGEVIIDLAGHSLAQSYAFYVAQRDFALVLATEGTSVTIINGVLGLSSSAAIRGDALDTLRIESISLRHFDSVGVECTNCASVDMLDTIVGPQNSNIPVLTQYAHSLRALQMPETPETSETARLRNHVHMVYDYVVSQAQPEDADEWAIA